MDKLIDSIEEYYDDIKGFRENIAEWKCKKAEMRNRYWSEATGIAKEKEDFIKSMTRDIDENIRNNEAMIEYAYNMIEVLNLRLIYHE